MCLPRGAPPRQSVAPTNTRGTRAAPHAPSDRRRSCRRGGRRFLDGRRPAPTRRTTALRRPAHGRVADVDADVVHRNAAGDRGSAGRGSAPRRAPRWPPARRRRSPARAWRRACRAPRGSALCSRRPRRCARVQLHHARAEREHPGAATHEVRRRLDAEQHQARAHGTGLGRASASGAPASSAGIREWTSPGARPLARALLSSRGSSRLRETRREVGLVGLGEVREGAVERQPGLAPICSKSSGAPSAARPCAACRCRPLTCTARASLRRVPRRPGERRRPRRTPPAPGAAPPPPRPRGRRGAAEQIRRAPMRASCRGTVVHAQHRQALAAIANARVPPAPRRARRRLP